MLLGRLCEELSSCKWATRKQGYVEYVGCIYGLVIILCGLPSLLEESVPRGQEIQYHGCIRRYHPRAFFCVPIDLNASLTAKTVASLFDDPASHWLFQLLPSVNFFGENLFGPAQSRVGGGDAYSV